MNSRKQNSTPKPRDPDFVGAEAAMRRAAARAPDARKKRPEPLRPEAWNMNWARFTGSTTPGETRASEAPVRRSEVYCLG